MAAVAGTYTRYDAEGLREDLTGLISRITPTKTPFLSSLKRKKVKQTLHEWQTDELAAANADNAVVDGDDVTFSTPTPTVRVGNYTQISRKEVIVSGTLEAVDKAGRAKEKAMQMAKKGAELKRDMETNLLDNQAAVAGSNVVARRYASMGAWIKTNVDFGATGANPVWTSGVPGAGRTDGTQRAFVETQLQTVLDSCYAEGAEPKILMVGTTSKKAVSGFAGIAAQTFNINSAKRGVIVGSADVYVGEYHTLRVVPNRFQRGRDAWLLDFEYLAIGYLRPFKREALAKTGDAEKEMLLVEYTFIVDNELSQGLVADLNS